LQHDLSIAEAAEVITADPQRANDVNSDEQAKRPLWPLETMQVDDPDSLTGKGVAKIGWSIPEATSLFWFIFNMDPSSPLSTGGSITVVAKHFGVWLKD